MQVMVVDEPRVRGQLGEILHNLGHQTLEVDDNEAAEALLVREHVDVVFAGWGLPGINGVELCRRLRAMERSFTYFVLMTHRASYRSSDALIALQAGVDDLLLKPVDNLELRGRLLVAERITRLHQDLEERNRQLVRHAQEQAHAARRDPLTGLWNRQRLSEEIAALEARHDRYGQTYCVVLIDVDHFKLYNDTAGHQAGDRVLRAVAEVLRTEVREGDLVFRFGGEEFLAVLTHQSPADAVRAVGRILGQLEGVGIPHPHPDAYTVVTASAGLAPARPGRGGFEEAVGAADRALYAAKAAGRNRVGIAGPGRSRATIVEWAAIH